MPKDITEPPYHHSQTLFTVNSRPMRFYMKPSSERRKLKGLIEHGGGILDGTITPESIRLAPEGFVVGDQETVSTDFILRSVRVNQPLKTEDFILKKSIKCQNMRTRNAFGDEDDFDKVPARMKKNRKKVWTKFTTRDDEAMLMYMEKHHKLQMAFGYELYKEMELKKVVSGHTYQSMNNRFRKIIMPKIEKYKCISEHFKMSLRAEYGKVNDNNRTKVANKKADSDTSQSIQDSEDDEDSHLPSIPVSKKKVLDRYGPNAKSLSSLQQNKPANTCWLQNAKRNAPPEGSSQEDTRSPGRITRAHLSQGSENQGAVLKTVSLRNSQNSANQLMGNSGFMTARRPSESEQCINASVRTELSPVLCSKSSKEMPKRNGLDERSKRSKQILSKNVNERDEGLNSEDSCHSTSTLINSPPVRRGRSSKTAGDDGAKALRNIDVRKELENESPKRDTVSRSRDVKLPKYKGYEDDSTRSRQVISKKAFDISGDKTYGEGTRNSISYPINSPLSTRGRPRKTVVDERRNAQNVCKGLRNLSPKRAPDSHFSNVKGSKYKVSNDTSTRLRKVSSKNAIRLDISGDEATVKDSCDSICSSINSPPSKKRRSRKTAVDEKVRIPKNTRNDGKEAKNKSPKRATDSRSSTAKGPKHKRYDDDPVRSRQVSYKKVNDDISTDETYDEDSRDISPANRGRPRKTFVEGERAKKSTRNVCNKLKSTMDSRSSDAKDSRHGDDERPRTRSCAPKKAGYTKGKNLSQDLITSVDESLNFIDQFKSSPRRNLRGSNMTARVASTSVSKDISLKSKHSSSRRSSINTSEEDSNSNTKPVFPPQKRSMVPSGRSESTRSKRLRSSVRKSVVSSSRVGLNRSKAASCLVENSRLLDKRDRGDTSSDEGYDDYRKSKPVKIRKWGNGFNRSVSDFFYNRVTDSPNHVEPAGGSDTSDVEVHCMTRSPGRAVEKKSDKLQKDFEQLPERTTRSGSQKKHPDGRQKSSRSRALETSSSDEEGTSFDSSDDSSFVRPLKSDRVSRCTSRKMRNATNGPYILNTKSHKHPSDLVKPSGSDTESERSVSRPGAVSKTVPKKSYHNAEESGISEFDAGGISSDEAPASDDHVALRSSGKIRNGEPKKRDAKAMEPLDRPSKLDRVLRGSPRKLRNIADGRPNTRVSKQPFDSGSSDDSHAESAHSPSRSPSKKVYQNVNKIEESATDFDALRSRAKIRNGAPSRCNAKVCNPLDVPLKPDRILRGSPRKFRNPSSGLMNAKVSKHPVDLGSSGDSNTESECSVSKAASKGVFQIVNEAEDSDSDALSSRAKIRNGAPKRHDAKVLDPLDSPKKKIVNANESRSLKNPLRKTDPERGFDLPTPLRNGESLRKIYPLRRNEKAVAVESPGMRKSFISTSKIGRDVKKLRHVARPRSIVEPRVADENCFSDTSTVVRDSPVSQVAKDRADAEPLQGSQAAGAEAMPLEKEFGSHDDGGAVKTFAKKGGSRQYKQLASIKPTLHLLSSTEEHSLHKDTRVNENLAIVRKRLVLDAAPAGPEVSSPQRPVSSLSDCTQHEAEVLEDATPVVSSEPRGQLLSEILMLCATEDELAAIRSTAYKPPLFNSLGNIGRTAASASTRGKAHSLHVFDASYKAYDVCSLTCSGVLGLPCAVFQKALESAVNGVDGKPSFSDTLLIIQWLSKTLHLPPAHLMHILRSIETGAS